MKAKGYPGVKATGLERKGSQQSDGRVKPRGVSRAKHLKRRGGRRM